MYEDFVFANDFVTETFTDINEALKKSYDISVKPNITKLGSIKVSNSGKIIYNGNEKLISKRGIESLFKILKLPISFTRNIPSDLLLYNIDKLIYRNSDETIHILERPNGDIASIVKGPYSEISYSDILSTFSEKPIKKIELSESMLKISFVFNNLKVPGLDNSTDSLYAGEFLMSSITGLTKLQIISGLYRTQCDNSFIMPLMGKLKANYSRTPDIRLLMFANAFECYSDTILNTVFNNFYQKTDYYLKEHQVKNIWDRASKIFSESDADMFFGFDENFRKILFSNVSTYLKEYKYAEKLGKELPVSPNTNYKAYDISNKITSAAHERLYDQADRIKAETLGGDILSWMIFLN